MNQHKPPARHGDPRSRPAAAVAGVDPYGADGVADLARQIARAATAAEVSALLELLLVRDGALITAADALTAAADWCGTQHKDSPGLQGRLRRMSAQIDTPWTDLGQATADLIGPLHPEHGHAAGPFSAPDPHLRRAQAAVASSPHRTVVSGNGNSLPPVPPTGPLTPPRRRADPNSRHADLKEPPSWPRSADRAPKPAPA